MASAKTPTLARYFAPFAGTFWILFLLLSVCVAPIWAFDIGETQIRSSIRVRELQGALLWISSIADFAWVMAASVIVYLSIARTAGLAAVRRWAGLVLAVSWIVGALSVWTTWPLGAIHFTGRFGPLLGPVSVGWLLLWCVVVLGARETVLAALPRAGHLQTTIFTAILAALTDINVEPLASKTRAWWLWMEKTQGLSFFATIQSSLAWFLSALAVSWFLRAPILTTHSPSKLPRSSQVFLLLNLLLLLSHLSQAFRT